MKGTIVFDGMNDVVFLAANEEFTQYVNNQGKEAGLIEFDAAESHTIDPNVAVQLFSPLAASQRFMAVQLDNPYSSVKCENGFLFVFKQFGDQLHLAINGDKTESEEFLKRKLSVFQKLVSVLFGPVAEEIKPDNSQERRARHKFLRRLLNTWVDLYQEEQSFLVEAVERLSVNQLVNQRCIQSLEHVTEMMGNAGDRHVQHALLLVNCKLLALYSSRNAVELQHSDTLSIIALVKNLLPSEERLEDLFSYSCRARENIEGEEDKGMIYIPPRESYQSAGEGDDEDSSGEVEYYSPRTTPVEERVVEGGTTDSSEPIAESSHKDGSGASSPYPKVSMQGCEEFFYTPRESEDTLQPGERMFEEGVSDGGESGARSSPLNNMDYQQLPVFLSTPGCQHTPYLLHCLKVFPGMNLVIVCQSPKAGYSVAICRTLNILKETLAGKSSTVIKERGGEVFEVLDTHMTKVLAVLKKLQLDRLHKDIRQRWLDCKKNHIEAYITGKAHKEIPPKLEAPLVYLHTKIRELFRLLYLSPRSVRENVERAVLDSQEFIKDQLGDFKDYLAVKAQRNVTMTTYLENYAGLVHFIYVDRMSNQITAPSMNIPAGEEANKHDATQWLKDKVWQMTTWLQGKLSQGQTTVTVRDGDFHFGYFLWFEDSAGHPLTVQQTFKPESVSLQPGVIAGNFYNQLVRSCFPNGIVGGIHCYELMTMHVGLVPSQFVLSHCRKLASELWETSSEAFTPISLL